MEQNQIQQKPAIDNPNPINARVESTEKSPLLFFLSFLVILLLVSTGFLAYQNWQLRSQLVNYEIQVSPTPTITSDPTTNWKTYTNTKYGYSIKYPDDWTINRGPGNLSDAELSTQRDVNFNSAEAAPPGVSLIIYTNELHPTGETANCQTLDDCISKVSAGFPSGETQDTTFLGESAVDKIYDRITNSYTQTNYHLFFMKDEDFYHFHFYSPKESYTQNKEILNLMLSTFKFLE